MTSFAKIVNGPGELDFVLNILRRQRGITFKLADEQEVEKMLFRDCTVRSVHCLTDEERFGKFGMDLELMVETSDWPDPAVKGFRCLYSALQRRGTILEMMTDQTMANDCARAKRLSNTIGHGTDIGPETAQWLKDHASSCEYCRSLPYAN